MMIRSVVIVTLAALLCGIIEVVLGQECAAGSAQFIAGNWYCQPITAITYRNFPGTGAYNRVVDMDINSGTCKSERHEYSGSLAPLNEELSIHLRGPIWLHQLAVYVPASSTEHEPRQEHEKRHGSPQTGIVGEHPQHGRHHLHHHNRAVRDPEAAAATNGKNKRAIGDVVIATIDGQRVSWINSYSGPPAPVPVLIPTTVATEIVFETVRATSFITVSGPCPTSTFTSTSLRTVSQLEYPESLLDDATKEGGDDAVKDAAKKAVDYAAESAAEDMAKDMAKDASKDMAKDASKDKAKDASKDKAKDASKDKAKDASEDKAKDATKDAAKGITKDSAKDATIGTAKETAKDAAKDMTKDTRKDATNGPAKETTKDVKVEVPSSSLIKQDTHHANAGSWTRQAYYNAAAGISTGFTFLNHHGGTNGADGSGTTDGGAAFGASLSYASSDGKTAVNSSRVLENALLQDGVELAIFSDRSCDDGGCGFTRKGSVAYHGFPSASKIFLIQFTMPFTGTRDDAIFNADMPAIWLLNAQIPHSSQYGTNPTCSCWTTGCGELDLFEVLDPGNFRCKSSLHMAPAGGCSEYFERPSGAPVTAVVVFSGERGVVGVGILDKGEDEGGNGEKGWGFGEAVEGGVVERWLDLVGVGGGVGWSVFDLGG